MSVPTKERAREYLAIAEQKNPGNWVEHSLVAAQAAQAIAAKCGMEQDRAYVLGLLHDIGRYEGFRSMHHIYAGYRWMKDEGYDGAARICITHSFPTQQFGEYFGAVDMTHEEVEHVKSLLASYDYDDYDRLLQLCDALAWNTGVCIIEKRLVNVVVRHGMNELTVDKFKKVLSLKDHFSNLCGESIYMLFDDVLENSL